MADNACVGASVWRAKLFRCQAFIQRRSVLLALGAALTAFAPTAFAQNVVRPIERPQQDGVTVGVGAGFTTSYDGANEYKAIPGGTLRGTVSGHDFFLRGLSFYIDAIPNGATGGIDVSLGPVAAIRTNRNGTVQDDRVAALGKLDTAFELGSYASLGIARGVLASRDKVDVGLTALFDVSGAHDSYILTPSVEYSTPVGRKAFMNLVASADVTGSRYANYYFGVTPEGSAQSGLRPYELEGGLKSVALTSVLTYAFDNPLRGWSVFGIGSYTRLVGDVANSPLVADVGSPDQFFGAAGLAYTF